MSNRPYFRYSGKELEDLFERSKGDSNLLKDLKVELGHRKRNKARVLEEKVDKILSSSYSNPNAPDISEPSSYSTDRTIRPSQETKTFTPTIQPVYIEPIVAKPNHTPLPEKYVVECAKCQTPNFIYALDGKTQYLSCSNCKTPFQASLKQGVLRTTFNSVPATSSSSKPSNNVVMYILAACVILFVIYILK